MRLLRILLLCVCPALSAAANEANDFRLDRALELPAHRWLQDIRQAEDTELAPFTTDGCSGGMSGLWSYIAETFPDFADRYWDTPPWEMCCVEHDRAYHSAGPDAEPEASFEARLTADTALRRCVRQSAETDMDSLTEAFSTTPERVRQAYDLISGAMYRAVRTGGGPCSGLPWRWGYGYPQCLGLFD